MVKAKINFSEDIGVMEEQWSDYWDAKLKGTGGIEGMQKKISKKIIDFPTIPVKGMHINLKSFDFGLSDRESDCLFHLTWFKIRWIVACKGYVEIYCDDCNKEGDD